MRCASQAYGVVYDCLEHLEEKFGDIANMFHFKYIKLDDGKSYANMNLYSDSGVLKGDFLICSMNEIGSMSFLRSERILNEYLGKNDLHKAYSSEIVQLKALM